jgi:type I restriction enzyme, S subunit
MKEWVARKISDFCNIEYGYTTSAKTDPNGPKFLRITDIQDNSVNWDEVPYCGEMDKPLEKYILRSGDIVFARTGATTGKSYLIKNPPEAVFASYLIRVRTASHHILPEFLWLFFQTQGYWKSIGDGTTGSAQGGFNATKLGALSISIPPLQEQSGSSASLIKRLTVSPQPKQTLKKTFRTLGPYLRATLMLSSHSVAMGG